MRAFLNDSPDPDAEKRGAQDSWSRREINYPERPARGASRPQARLIERVAARIGFASFERVFVGLTAAIVLAGCAIMFRAAFDNPNPAGDAALEPTIIVAKRDKPAEAEAPADAFASKAPIAPPHATSIAATPSMLSQTPVRESAREALALASPPAEPVRETAAPEDAAPPAQALGYADAPSAAEPPAKATDDAGRPTPCFVKVGGRVLTKGNCKVSHKGASVTLTYAGSTITIAPSRGREWTLSVGGRTVGRVYKSGGACWGSRNHTWVCERGA